MEANDAPMTKSSIQELRWTPNVERGSLQWAVPATTSHQIPELGRNLLKGAISSNVDVSRPGNNLLMKYTVSPVLNNCPAGRVSYS